MIKSVDNRVDNRVDHAMSSECNAGCHHHHHRSHLSVTVLHCWSFSVVQTFSWTVEHFSSAAAEQSCSLTVSATGGEFNLDLLSIIMQAVSATSLPHLWHISAPRPAGSWGCSSHCTWCRTLSGTENKKPSYLSPSLKVDVLPAVWWRRYRRCR